VKQRRWGMSAAGMAVAGVAGCAASGNAPVEFRGDAAPLVEDAALTQPVQQSAQVAPEPPPLHEPAPVVFANAAPTPAIEAETGAGEADQAAAEAAPGQWEDAPGLPLSTFALRPEEAHPFDPRHPPASHTVRAGETLAQVAARYQTPLRRLIDANNLTAPFALREGQTLNIPRPHLHTVRAGETLLSLSRTYSIDVRSLALLNRLDKPYTIRPGDVLALPMDARPVQFVPVTSTPSPPAATGRFEWPVRGEILTGFGPGGHGRRSDGVDIAAAPGAPIQAAAAGRVVYAGDDLPGYGLLVLVQHEGGWVTAYARAGALAVREGDQVRRGQTLGTVGQVGAGPSRLHFQVRQAGAARDPLGVLPRV